MAVIFSTLMVGVAGCVGLPGPGPMDPLGSNDWVTASQSLVLAWVCVLTSCSRTAQNSHMFSNTMQSMFLLAVHSSFLHQRVSHLAVRTMVRAYICPLHLSAQTCSPQSGAFTKY